MIRARTWPESVPESELLRASHAGAQRLDADSGSVRPEVLQHRRVVFKNFKFSEKRSVQFRVEGFNFLNHPIYSFGFDNNLNLAFNSAGQQTNALFGTTTTKAGHRIMQFVAKFYF